MSSHTSVNIDGYTAYDNVDESDDHFNILWNASLVLLDDDTLTADLISGAGQLRVRGNTMVDDLLLLNTVTMINTEAMTLSGSIITYEQSSVEAPTIRNIAGASLTLADNVAITGAEPAKLVNFGLLETATDGGVVDGSSAYQGAIAIDFYDRGGAVDIQQGVLAFTGAVERFVNGEITGGGQLTGQNVVLASTTMSVAEADFDQLRVVGDVAVSSPFFSCDDLTLGAGGTLELTNSTVTLSQITGVGEIAFRGTTELTGYLVNIGVDQSLQFTNAVTLVNYGDLNIAVSDAEPGYPAPSMQISLQPGNGKQIAIENEAGAKFEIGGDILGPSDGSAIIYNYGTFDAEGYTFFGFDYNNDRMEFEFSPAEVGVEVVNDGVMTTSTGFMLDAAVTGAGSIEVGRNTHVEGAVGSGQTLAFQPLPSANAETEYSPLYPTLSLDDVGDFAGAITGFDQNGAADDQLVVNTSVWAYQGFVPNAGGTGGELMFSDGAQETGVTLIGQYDPTGFHASASTLPGTTTITYSG